MFITASAQGVPDPSSNDPSLFNLNSQTRRSQTARDPISTLDISRSRYKQGQQAIRSCSAHGSSLHGGPFNPT
ncbi:hypothetical protein DY000_02052773 [Brassica cretica]|uniref:Uncharacterized protein n=1 Tax=Brassica cretica TaxID=69181 RepID=A0ABQ7AH33_BRACR|nr:hypothetical protein DY000_02052773 [Brassica cretica]